MTARVCVLHGPNLNLLGIREPDIYGQDSYDEMNRKIKDRAKQLEMEVRIFQSNSEGDIIDAPYGRLAMFADPFGHGFCLIEFSAQGYDAIAGSD